VAPEPLELDFVVVTGAGASTALGAAGSRLPMMGEWCNALVQKLLEQNYLAPTGLYKSMEPMQFEDQLGRFLRQVTAFSQVKEIVSTSVHFPEASGTSALSTTGVLDSWYSNTKAHLARIVEQIHVCLYEQFAEPRYDPQLARDSYHDLFEALRITPGTNWVYATTNYDILGETALGLLGFKPDWGDVSSAENVSERQVAVDGLIEGLPRFTPVLHIHGRVGWYRRDLGNGPTVYSAPVTRHQPGFGIPIVMLPDPDKAYDSDPIINSLWLQFIDALKRANRVFVLGHSLNDTVLAQALRDHVPLERLAITVLADSENRGSADESAASQVSQLGATFPGAAIVPIRFGELPVYAPAIEAWLKRTSG
jgi:hypothetical protein